MNEHYCYLVGFRNQEDGVFWCREEFNCQEQAIAAFKKCCKTFPDKHIDLIQSIKMFKVIDTYYPSARTE